jgi:hypothetical protein
MKDSDFPEDPESQAGQTETSVGPDRTPWLAFIEHLRHGHGVENVPEEEAEAWRLHQRLHGR